MLQTVIPLELLEGLWPPEVCADRIFDLESPTVTGCPFCIHDLARLPRNAVAVSFVVVTCFCVAAHVMFLRG